MGEPALDDFAAYCFDAKKSRHGNHDGIGTPDAARTHDLQSQSYQAVKPESPAAQGFDWYRTNFWHFEEKPQKPCRAGLLRFFAVVVK